MVLTLWLGIWKRTVWRTRMVFQANAFLSLARKISPILNASCYVSRSEGRGKKRHEEPYKLINRNNLKIVCFLFSPLLSYEIPESSVGTCASNESRISMAPFHEEHSIYLVCTARFVNINNMSSKYGRSGQREWASWFVETLLVSVPRRFLLKGLEIYLGRKSGAQDSSEEDFIWSDTIGYWMVSYGFLPLFCPQFRCSNVLIPPSPFVLLLWCFYCQD